ncbi:hypothetical protein HMPREF1586_00712, partial [Gardnerella vaginalis JCP8522]
FAMATPAFAADKAPKAPTSYKEAQDAANTAAATLDTAKNTYTADEAAAKKATEAWNAAKGTPAKGAKEDQTTHVYAQDPTVALTKDEQGKLDEFLKKQSDVKTTADKASESKTALDNAQKAYDAAVLALRGFAPVPDKEDDDYSVALSADATRLQTATKKVKDAFAKANKLYGEWKSAQAKANNAAKTLADFENSHDLTGLNKADKAEHGRLTKAATDAQSKADTLKTKYDDAYSKFDEAFTAYSTAFASYKTDFYLAKDHKDSLVLGYRTPEDIELLKSDFQPGVGFVGSSDEVTTPGAPAGQPGAAQPGKPGAPAAGANGAAGKAGAKTEVENKNGKDKRGNTHTGTGVGVTLTA